MYIWASSTCEVSICSISILLLRYVLQQFLLTWLTFIECLIRVNVFICVFWPSASHKLSDCISCWISWLIYFSLIDLMRAFRPAELFGWKLCLFWQLHAFYRLIASSRPLRVHIDFLHKDLLNTVFMFCCEIIAPSISFCTSLVRWTVTFGHRVHFEIACFIVWYTVIAF